ncbi:MULTISPECIES: endo-1,4-beta-xylanase [unclassified Agarivorans]|uniref:endo-1,4-beta-xylanase n=1 Tax=unclassified Agarivorans TaxID=2636026 RepID=UPI0026E41DEF|nr:MULTISPECIES: endo-1,4-beta-xylanase [unclassified Agarivorans]MDO6683969.1 endo-1,4-beta-xylanase [Agarivorans sp. 3_MG-2023]MDO6714298.1 endo-1,4-beta-xylanase [Agarivorans sp. 2_MG-2023]
MRISYSALLPFAISVALSGCGGSSSSEPQEPIRIPQVESLKKLSSIYMGAAVPAGYEGQFNNGIETRPDLQDVVNQHFDQITAENIMKSAYIQPREGDFTFQDADNLVDWAIDNNITVHAHALVWHSQMPSWMENFSGDWLAMMDNHVTTVAEHFKGRVVSWDVVNEAFNDNNINNYATYRDTDANSGGSGSPWYRNLGKDFIPQAFNLAHAADPTVELYYNDYNIEDGGAKLNSVLRLADELLADSVPIDGIGFQMHVNYDWPSAQAIGESFAKVAAKGLKVKITELDIKMNPTGNNNTFDNARAEEQLQRYQDIVEAYYSNVPAAQRGGITIWGVSDADSWIPGFTGHNDWPLLFNNQLEQKPAIEGVANALK